MFENAALLQAQFPNAPLIIAFMFGATIGSFLNVVVYRLPVMMNRSWQEQAADIIDEAVDDAELMERVRLKLPTYPSPFNLVKPNSTCPSCG
ncbi:MAG: leader peptidase (prepilin peptidase)/N-methyltransferase, partial [Candidatus Azotimanducaceae bacterium]